jgi:hypothetical protein
MPYLHHSAIGCSSIASLQQKGMEFCGKSKAASTYLHGDEMVFAKPEKSGSKSVGVTYQKESFGACLGAVNLSDNCQRSDHLAAKSSDAFSLTTNEP